MKLKNLILFINLLAISCQNSENYIPPQDQELPTGLYNKYKTLLDTAYSKNDHFEVAIQLANLNAPKDKIFSNLDMGIRGDTQNCYRVYEWHTLFKENNFLVNLVKADTLRFENEYQVCIDLLGKQKFIDYQQALEDKHNQEVANRVKLDTTKFDLDLMNQLEQIEKDDQDTREKMSAKNISEEDVMKLWKIQDRLDSINLIRVDHILNAYGYPRPEKVGYDLANTVWLVLHHQPDISVRDKYQEIIEDNAGEGQIKAYNWRSADIRLEQENVKTKEKNRIP